MYLTKDQGGGDIYICLYLYRYRYISCVNIYFTFIVQILYKYMSVDFCDVQIWGRKKSICRGSGGEGGSLGL